MTAAAPARIVVQTIEMEDVAADLPHVPEKILSADERDRAARFRFHAHRHRFVAAHALKRTMLERIGGMPARDWVFANGPHGKPHVAGGPHFNLSHCDGLVACAVSTDVAVGVDIEPLDRVASLSLADRWFAPSERDWLLALPDGERAHGFLHLWTAKEAYLKATGDGLSRDLASFAIAFDPPRILDPAAATPWRLRQTIVAGRFLLSLCWPGPDADVEFDASRLEDFFDAGPEA